nr:immunoglobulin light chain junction region [Macaca mulatta]
CGAWDSSPSAGLF